MSYTVKLIFVSEAQIKLLSLDKLSKKPCCRLQVTSTSPPSKRITTLVWKEVLFKKESYFLKLVTFIFCRKEVTKPRNKTKEFLFNLIFFLILPFLLLFKLGRKIIKCCKKDSNTKQEKEKQDENEGDRKAKGSAVDIFKEGDIMKNGSPRAESDQSVKLFTEKAEVSGGSKENVTTERSRINNLVIKKGEQDRGNDIATGGGSQGIKRKISAQGSRRGVKEHVTEPSKDKPTSKGEEQQTGTSQTSDEVTVNRTEPSEPQVRDLYVCVFETEP